jgi:hypothetical protein
VALGLPLSFHILTSTGVGLEQGRGPKINNFPAIMRANQDIIGMFIFGRVFERHPKLKLVCVEADAGWAPYHTDNGWDGSRTRSSACSRSAYSGRSASSCGKFTAPIP